MKDLFSEFSPVTGAQWKERITRDLKGEPFENLIWKNENGFDVQPFYTAENIKGPVYPAFLHSGWEICAASQETNASGINRDLLYQLSLGATAILVESGRHNYENLLREIDLGIISSTFFCTTENLDALTKYLGKNYKGAGLDLNLFPAGQIKRGDMQAWINNTRQQGNGSARTIAVDSLAWFNAGALPVYELALILANLVEWLETEDKTGIPSPAGPVIRTGVDSDLFVQIAKLRAMRRLWAILKSEFGRSGDLYIICETSLANKAIADPYNNLLRSSVEAFSAIAGGCNALVAHGFDALTGKPNKTATRLALNQQHILKEECYLDKMGDVGCGSYFIESLTDNLASAALDAFKNIARGGGYFAALEKGLITKEIAGQYDAKAEKIRSGEQTVVGVNRFRNNNDTTVPDNVGELLKAKSIRNPVVSWEQQQDLKKV